MQKYHTLFLLLTAYAAATWVPAPGLWLRELELFSPAIRLPQLLLAGLLFSAGLCTARGAAGGIAQMRRRLAVFAVIAWLIPLLSAVVSVAGLWWLMQGPASVALGLVIVAAMPVANSSVGWATSLRGSVPVSIALLVVGTALSPLLSPAVIGVGATSLGTAEQALRETPWSAGMGGFFLVWVLSPVLWGAALATRLSAQQAQRLSPHARRLSFAILIVLNYLNGAPCLPALANNPQLLWWPLIGSVTLLLLSYVGVHLANRLFQAAAGERVSAHSDLPTTAEQTSLILAVVMRNTGAALVFAGAALPSYVLVSLTIIAYTMLQHCWVGFFLAPTTAPSPLQPSQPNHGHDLSATA